MIPFLFAVHSHQPVGNFGWVFEQGVRDSYHPFLELLSEFPRVKVSIHYSGCLLEWIEEHRPDHVELLRDLVDKGQVEILGGGFFEPILTVIPERDAVAQLSSYADHLEQVFGKRPRGAWLTERVWDPGLPAVLEKAGVEFTLVDDSHFRYGGLTRDDLWGPFLTECRGRSNVIFPIDKYLRYIIPFKEPEETIRYIKERAEKAPGFMACYGDDGEKFGMWPGTREWVFEKGWLRRFLAALDAARDEIETMHFGDYLYSHRPRARVYLPPASYDEMMEWVLPPRLGRRLLDFKHELEDAGRYEDLAPFVRGGHWDMFLAKYEESNRMQKRMLLASEALDKISDPPKEARLSLLRGQCNCAYWHGVFGGLYLNYLRHAIYEQLIEAEALAGAYTQPALAQKDYDLDGGREVLVFSPGINVIFKPHRGGGIEELEYPPKRFCLSNLMSRRIETYHDKLRNLASRGEGDAPATIHDEMGAKEDGLDKLLIVDRFPRHSFLEHLLSPGFTPESLEREEAGFECELAGAEYDLLKAEPADIRLRRETLDNSGGRVAVEKRFSFGQERSGLDCAYDVAIGDQPEGAAFAVELNLTLLAGSDPGRYFLVGGEKPEEPEIGARGDHPEAALVEMVDEAFGFRVVIKLGRAARFVRFPVETVSQSEGGYERNYQGTALWLIWPAADMARDGRIEIAFDLANLGK